MLLLHVSGHGLVLNSAGFERAGIDASTHTRGGVIVRKPGSQEPAGLLMETAAMPVYGRCRNPMRRSSSRLDAVQKEYARNGSTTIQDGATDARLVGMFKAAAQQGALWLDMVALPLVMNPADLETQLTNTFGSYSGHLKFGGIRC
ncbi:MAG: amidohydrolase family protein [Gammaproteobacteria bacterium]|nr:amidohydrolase family protein [Gammaproteobacteria bacterium]